MGGHGLVETRLSAARRQSRLPHVLMSSAPAHQVVARTVQRGKKDGSGWSHGVTVLFRC